MEKKALHNQSASDFLLQHTGSVVGAISFCIANNIALTDDLVPGNFYTIPDNIIKDEDILKYFTDNGFKPATGFKDNGVIITDYGIGDMAIGNTFIIR